MQIIELLEKTPGGIFPTLDAQCKMPKASDDTFCQALHKTHGPESKTPSSHFDKLSHAKLKGVHLKDDECFVIKHFGAPLLSLRLSIPCPAPRVPPFYYIPLSSITADWLVALCSIIVAADVCYTSAGFLEKNSDALADEFTTLLRNSSIDLVKHIVDGPPEPQAEESTKPGGKAAGMVSNRGNMSARKRRQSTKEADSGRTGKASSVGKKFLLGLKQLMREIATTHPYFVRCIKPNNTLKPGDFNGAMILRQMQCSGTIECVKLMQAGYPSRAPYDDLRQRFKGCLPDFMDSVDNETFIKLLLSACGDVARRDANNFQRTSSPPHCRGGLTAARLPRGRRSSRRWTTSSDRTWSSSRGARARCCRTS